MVKIANIDDLVKFVSSHADYKCGDTYTVTTRVLSSERGESTLAEHNVNGNIYCAVILADQLRYPYTVTRFLNSVYQDIVWSGDDVFMTVKTLETHLYGSMQKTGVTIERIVPATVTKSAVRR